MSPKKILIVEDEIITAMHEKECLETLGYEVTGIVDTGEEAIKKVETDKPDLVLMDITLKGEMDGVQAAWKIRDDHGIPVIFVTAHGDKVIYEDAMHGHLTGYIVKPFTVEDLKENVEAALQGRI